MFDQSTLFYRFILSKPNLYLISSPKLWPIYRAKISFHVPAAPTLIKFTCNIRKSSWVELKSLWSKLIYIILFTVRLRKHQLSFLQSPSQHWTNGSISLTINTNYIQIDNERFTDNYRPIELRTFDFISVEIGRIMRTVNLGQSTLTAFI